MKRMIALILLGLALMGSVLGCNTLRGAGEDIEGAGEEIQKSTTP
nr:entericidin A/B family lipoprotein [Deltaproteobacteria bacterium]